MHHVSPHRQVGPARYSKPLQPEHPPRPGERRAETGGGAHKTRPARTRLDWWMVLSAGICVLSAVAVLGFVGYVLLFKVGL